jgi:hypothetical protein
MPQCAAMGGVGASRVSSQGAGRKRQFLDGGLGDVDVNGRDDVGKWLNYRANVSGDILA